MAGEDAALVAAYGAAFVRGVQGEGGADPAHLLAAATLKHWVCTTHCLRLTVCSSHTDSSFSPHTLNVR